MKVKLIVWVILFAFITACGNNTAASSIPTIPASTSTLLSTLTITPSPTITLSPTATQFPPLSGESPYLVLRQDFDAQEIIIYDHDGGGRRIVNLPRGGRFLGAGSAMSQIIAPDGKWLAFYTGSLGGGGNLEKLPVTLNIMNINDGSIKKIADVVTEGYQSKLNQVAENLKTLNPDWYKPIDDIDWVYGATSLEFPYGIYATAWSPSSQYLAFAGQIDGISSDVYLYNVGLDSIQRLNDDVQNVSGIRWSPDGSYLILYNSIPGYVYPGSSLHYLIPDEKTVRNPESIWARTWGGIVDWLSPNLLLMTGGTDTAGSTDLQALSIATGQVWSFWKGLYGEVAIDHVNSVIAITTSDYTPPENPGIYFIDFNGNKNLVRKGYYYNLIFRGGEKHRFLAMKYSLQDGENLVAAALDGTVDSLEYIEDYKTSISPDYTWLLIYNGQEANLYDANDILVEKYMISGIQEVQWRPDSKGLFYSIGEELYYLSVPEGNVLFVDKCVVGDCYFNLDDFYSVWLP